MCFYTSISVLSEKCKYFWVNPLLLSSCTPLCKSQLHRSRVVKFTYLWEAESFCILLSIKDTITDLLYGPKLCPTHFGNQLNTSQTSVFRKHFFIQKAFFNNIINIFNFQTIQSCCFLLPVGGTYLK